MTCVNQLIEEYAWRMPPAEPDPRPPRRAPRDEERGRAAERTREKILAAAVVEFGAKGYAGARTASIAARAGVNQQLLAYYFGGKQGVLDELRRRWSEQQDTMAQPDDGFAASLTAHLDQTLDNPDWARLVIWRALGDGPDDGRDAASQAEQQTRLRTATEGIRRRQSYGELTPDIEPEFILLLSYLIAFAPIALPHVVTALYGTDPGSADYRRRSREQLLALLRTAPDGSGRD
jgi:AcrR family transcriptional regulator